MRQKCVFLFNTEPWVLVFGLVHYFFAGVTFVGLCNHTDKQIIFPSILLAKYGKTNNGTYIDMFVKHVGFFLLSIYIARFCTHSTKTMFYSGSMVKVSLCSV